MKLLIVESNALYRDAFERHLSRSDRFDVIEQLYGLDPVSFPREVVSRQPDLVLIGVGVADTQTLDTVNDVLNSDIHPGVVLHGRSLTLPAALRITEMLRSVISGFAYLDTDRIEQAEDLVSICTVVADGRVVIDPPTMQRILGMVHSYAKAMEGITEPQRLLLDRMARGDSDDAIASRLGIQPSQVADWITAIAGKFGVDPASRDARVATTLRYLVAIGELPIDYDTGVEPAQPQRDARGAPTPVPPATPQAPPSRQEPPSVEEVARGPVEDRADDEAIAPEVVLPSHDVSQEAGDPGSPLTEEAGFRYGEEGVSQFGRFTELGQREDIEVAGHVLAWAATRGLRVRWGSGHNEGSFAVVLDVGEESHWLVTLWAIGTVDIQFAMLMAHPPFSDEALRKELAKRLEQLPDVKIGEEGLTGRPSMLLAALQQPEDLRTFTSALEWVVDEIRQSGKPPGTPPSKRDVRLSPSVRQKLQDEHPDAK